MDKLIKNGYAFLVKTSIVSIMGNNKVSYWGCVCPIQETGPFMSITYISEKKLSAIEFDQKYSLDDLEESLLDKAIKRWPRAIDHLDKMVGRF